jgi:hypothetical protein
MVMPGADLHPGGTTTYEKDEGAEQKKKKAAFHVHEFACRAAFERLFFLSMLIPKFTWRT